MTEREKKFFFALGERGGGALFDVVAAFMYEDYMCEGERGDGGGRSKLVCVYVRVPTFFKRGRGSWIWAGVGST